MLAFNLKNNLKKTINTNINNIAKFKMITPRVKFSTLNDLEILQTKVDKQSQQFQVRLKNKVNTYYRITILTLKI